MNVLVGRTIGEMLGDEVISLGKYVLRTNNMAEAKMAVEAQLMVIKELPGIESSIITRAPKNESDITVKIDADTAALEAKINRWTEYLYKMEQRMAQLKEQASADSR